MLFELKFVEKQFKFKFHESGEIQADYKSSYIQFHRNQAKNQETLVSVFISVTNTKLVIIVIM